MRQILVSFRGRIRNHPLLPKPLTFQLKSSTFIKKTLEKVYEKEDYNRKDEIQKTSKELERLKTRKTNLQNDYMDRAITPADYQEMKEIVKKEPIWA